MKYRVISSTVILAIILLALAIRGCSNTEMQVDEYGNPIEYTQ